MSKVKVALTTGDIDGIGFEVTAKALYHLGPQRNAQFFLWRSKNVPKKYLKLIDKKWVRVTVDSLENALKIKGSYLIDIESDLSPAEWVEISARACLNRKIDGLATAPISKTGIKEAGFKDLGHTDILKRISKSKSVNMGFIGNKFNVVLATSHIPLSKVANDIKRDNSLLASLKNANSLRLKLPAKIKNKPIAILGLNPHAGEEGLIGADELQFYPKLKKFADKNNIPISEPLVPDAAFFPMNWKKYSVYLALYHDQGLIPFKLVHGQTSGVHISLGIPFIRTSVDHGTAKNIFGKDKANPNSMMDAIEWAVKLARL
ncbi:MAG: 4-hydroxythreonine-4-phosphate dehydrogenase PdxA [Bdellovibrio sp.]